MCVKLLFVDLQRDDLWSGVPPVPSQSGDDCIRTVTSPDTGPQSNAG